MRAAVFFEPGKVELDTFQEPILEDGDIKIKVELCGVCGSDIKTYVRGILHHSPCSTWS